MKSCPVLLLCGFLFAGCSVQQPLVVTPTAAPQIIVVTATPSPNLPPVVAAATPNSPTAEDSTWMEAANKLLEAVKVDPAIIKSTNDITDTRANIVQAAANYNQTQLPTKFTKADFYLRQGVAEEYTGLDLLEKGFRANDRELAMMGKPHYVESARLMTKAIDEMQSVASAP
ncbi:hypothetical protein EON83_11105 [bacterium]|nr:MAG: hypothetical protein EON83_11105 [bacterium]